MVALELIGLFLAGILAGEEFIVRYGVQPALSRLDDFSHIRARQALVRRMRWVVPAIMVPTVLVAILVVIVGGLGPGCWFRIAGLAALIAFLLFSFLGTVPINIRVNGWDLDNPPDDWKALVARWQLIDVFRSGAAILAFAFFLIAAAVS